MSYVLIIMENEFHSLLKSFFKKIIKDKYHDENNIFLESLKEVSIKFIACIIGYYIYETINNNFPNTKKIVVFY